MDNSTFILYEQFIRVVTERLDEYFKNQSEYLCCKEGCSLCCSTGMYPCTKLELDYLYIGFLGLLKETQDKIMANISKIKEEKSNSGEKKFLHTCPFLIDNRCSVYNHRMLVCRTFGLIYQDENGSMNMPFCIDNGLNYSLVYDREQNKILAEKVKTLGYKNDPVAYNLNFYQLRKKVGEEMLNLDFGEEKALIDWL